MEEKTCGLLLTPSSCFILHNNLAIKNSLSIDLPQKLHCFPLFQLVFDIYIFPPLSSPSLLARVSLSKCAPSSHWKSLLCVRKWAVFILWPSWPQQEGPSSLTAQHAPVCLPKLLWLHVVACGCMHPQLNLGKAGRDAGSVENISVSRTKTRRPQD